MSVKTTRKKPTVTIPKTILKLVSRKNGSTVKRMQDATGWQRHSVRAAITALRKKGHAVVHGKDARGATVYRLSE